MYEIQGRTVTLPLHIARATAGIAAFSASAPRIAERLPTGLQPLCLPTGRGVVVLMLVDYVDNPLGAYDEAVVAFAALPTKGRSRTSRWGALLRGHLGLWIEHMPVTEAFTREAGETIWGYPKTLDDLTLSRTADRATLTWRRDDHAVLTLEVPTGGTLRPPPIRGTTYTSKDGTLHRTALTFRSEGVRVGPGGHLSLGSHRIARRLADLDLRERAFASTWMERASMDFRDAVPVRSRSP